MKGARRATVALFATDGTRAHNLLHNSKAKLQSNFLLFGYDQQVATVARQALESVDTRQPGASSYLVVWRCVTQM